MQTTEKVVVQLQVLSDGALRALNQFNAGMDGAGKATAKAGAGVDAYTAQMQRMRAAAEANIPVLKARAAVMDAEERALANIVGKSDPAYRARINAERDLSRAAAAASNLVVRGRLNEADAIRHLTAIEQAHAKAVANAAGNATRTAVANDNLAASYRRVGQSSGFATSNVAAQLQDIAVTSQMGMSPLQIALQQGTQLSAALGGQGLTGTVRTLGAAFASIVSPVSLVTMGIIALGSYGIQALMSMSKGTKDASEALKEHAEWLDNVLTGYTAAQDAAAGFVEAANIRPQGAVASDLEAARLKALKEVDTALASIAAKEQEISTDLRQMGMSRMIHADTIAASTALQDLGLSARSTNAEIDSVQVQLTRLANDTGASDQARQYGRDMLALVDQLDSARAQVDSLSVSLNNLPRSIPIIVQMHGLAGVADAVAQLQGMTPDVRNERQRADDIFSNNIGQSRTISEINALVDAHTRFNEQLDLQEQMERAALEARQASASATRDAGAALTQPPPVNFIKLAAIQAARIEKEAA